MFSQLGWHGIDVLLAQASGIHVGKGIAMIVFFGAIGLFSTAALFVSNETLQTLSSTIGTDKPRVARIVCLAAAIVGWVAVAVTVASLMGNV